MILQLYKTKSSNNTINKVLTEIKEIEINFKDVLDIKNPIIYLTMNIDLFSYNYAIIPKLNKKYFIDSIEVENKDILKFNLRVDVLETYKDDILNCNSLISISDNGNKFIEGLNTIQEVRKESDIYLSNKTIENNESIIIVVMN